MVERGIQSLSVAGPIVIQGNTLVDVRGTALEPVVIHDAPDDTLLVINWHPDLAGLIEHVHLTGGRQGLGIFGGDFNWRLAIAELRTWGMDTTAEEHIDLHSASRVAISNWTAEDPSAPGAPIGLQGIKMGDGVVFSFGNRLTDCRLNGFLGNPILGAGAWACTYERVTLANCGGNGFDVGRGATLRECTYTDGVNGAWAARVSGETSNTVIDCVLGPVCVEANTVAHVNGCQFAALTVRDGAVVHVPAAEFADLGPITLEGSGAVVTH